MRGAAFAWALAGALLCSSSLAEAQSGGPPQRSGDGVTVAPYTPGPLLLEVPPRSAEDVLPPEDEMAFSRAVLLLRAGRLEEAAQEFERLGKAYPHSRRVTSVRASVWTRRGEPKRALALLDQAEARQRDEAARQRSDAAPPELPLEIEHFSLERAEAYIVLGDRDRAIPWMIEAVDRRAGGTEELHERLLEWAGDATLGPRVAREAGRRSDADPDRISLAILAAEVEAVAGAWDRAFERLGRTEEAALEVRSGELARALARRLSSNPAIPAATDARAWLGLATSSPSEGIRMEAFRLLVEPLALPPKDGVEVRASLLPASDLVSAWLALPAVPERETFGLRLAGHLRDRAEWQAADRVAARITEERLPSDLRGAARLEQGLARMRAGALDEGRSLIEQAAQEATGHETRAHALYALAEARYFGGDFEGAHEALTEFVRLFPREPETNDALERLYLLEGGSAPSGPTVAPGLPDLAAGHYAAARGDWEEALARAEAAAALAASSGGDDDVRVQAALLRSAAHEASGLWNEAVVAALWVADSLAAHRLAPLARRRAADLLLAAGRPEEALVQYEEILVRHPDSWIAPEVRRRVMELRSGRVQ